MPAPEQSPDARTRGADPTPYFQVSRFRTERRAGRTYQQVQKTLRENECDLSTYRFLWEQISHVAVLGSRPAEALVQVLERFLAAGEPTTVPAEVQSALEARREQARQLGSWVEGHYRPGRPVQTDKPER